MKRAGFTLIEVMVALVIFAAATVAFAAAYVNVLNAYEVVSRGDAHIEDVRFARAQLLAEPDRQKAEEGGDFMAATGGGQVRWSSAIEPTTTTDVFRVTFKCEVSEVNAARPMRPVEQVFYLLRPTWTEGGDQSKLRDESRKRIVELRRKMP